MEISIITPQDGLYPSIQVSNIGSDEFIFLEEELRQLKYPEVRSQMTSVSIQFGYDSYQASQEFTSVPLPRISEKSSRRCLHG